MTFIKNILILLLLSGCISTSHSLKLLHEVPIEEVIESRHKECETEYFLENFVIDKHEEVMKEAEAKCSEENLKAFQYVLKDGFKIYYYEELDKNGFGEVGYALVIDNQIIEKYITDLLFITT